jgi:hypothetical protein
VPKRSTLIGVALTLGFGGMLVVSTLRAQREVCEVCVSFNGGENCATASGETKAEAARTAQNTACGPLVRGMNDAIACDNRPPIRAQCRTK